MSRISRHQESIDKFLKKYILSKNELENIDLVVKNLNLFDHIPGILLNTVLFSLIKKKGNMNAHPMACGVDIMMFLSIITDKKRYYEEDFGKDRYKNLCNELIITIYKSLSQNMETVKTNGNSDTSIKIYTNCINFINKKIYDISKIEELLSNKKMIKNDVSTLKFKNKDIIKTKYAKLYKIDREIILKYIEDKFGKVCQCALVLGWILGDGDEKTIEKLENMGLYFGNIIKICYDFQNIEEDIDNANKTTTNVIANIGVHESFTLFIENKIKFIEGCTALDIYTNTMKEVMDLIEDKIDNCLEKSNIDLKSTYSSFSSIKKNK
jgi:hypothetical protein